MPKRVLQHALLGGGLAGQVQVLHRAAAAGAEVRTGWLHALARRAQYAQNMRLFVTRFAPVADVVDGFAGQGTFDENHLAINVRNAASFVIQGFDVC